MSLDLSSLRPPDPVDFVHYQDGSKSAKTSERIPLPVKGIYRLQNTKPIELGATNDGYLQILLPEVMVCAPDEAWDGYLIRFSTRLSTKKWPNREGSSMNDYLLAHGVDLTRLDNSNEQYIQLVESLNDRQYEGLVDLEAYCKKCGYRLAGYDNIPTNGDGHKATYVECPSCRDDQDRPLRVWVNARVKAFMKPRA